MLKKKERIKEGKNKERRNQKKERKKEITLFLKEEDI